jgi:hypothetical protein
MQTREVEQKWESWKKIRSVGKRFRRLGGRISKNPAHVSAKSNPEHVCRLVTSCLIWKESRSWACEGRLFERLGL